MDVIEIIKTLIKLQKLEDEIAKLTSQKNKLPFLLKSAQLKLGDEQENLKKLNLAISKNQKNIKSSEAEVSGISKRINDVRKQQSDSKSNKEFKTFSEFIDKYNADIQAQEEVQLALMEDIEKLEEKKGQINEKQEYLTQQLKLREKELEQNFSVLESQINILVQKQTELFALLSDDTSEQFKKLIELRNGQAISSVEVINIEEGGSCTACGTTLIRPIVQKLLAKNEIITCPACSRILYLPSVM